MTVATPILSAQNYVLHQIDGRGKTINLIPINADLPDLDAYLYALLKEIGDQNQLRKYEFSSTTTEFYTCLTSFARGTDLKNNTYATTLAERLLRIEIETDEQYGHLSSTGTHVTKGSFLQFIFPYASGISYLGVKIEHQSFLDEIDFKKKSGLSETRKLYKACRVDFDDQKIPKNVVVYDTNSKPSVYWWNKFLELKVFRDDATNTKLAAEAVMRVIGTLKSKHAIDHTILRNAAVAAFKQQGSMKYLDFVSTIFDQYVPEDAVLKPLMGIFIDKLKKLPEKENFDTDFTLVPAAVPFKQTKYNLSPEITLSIKDGIENLKDKIWAEKTSDGKYLVVIESDEAKNFTLKHRG